LFLKLLPQNAISATNYIVNLSGHSAAVANFNHLRAKQIRDSAEFGGGMAKY
jgi:hypothetical protein